MNPQKLAGQCAKLKCCLNYEVDAYVEAQKGFPSRDITLETLDNTYYFFKADILNGQLSYSTDKVFAANVETITPERALEIIAMNRKGQKPASLDENADRTDARITSDILTDGDLSRFDRKKKKKHNRNNRPQQENAGGGAQAEHKAEHKAEGENGQRPDEGQKPQGNHRNGNDRRNRPHHNGPRRQDGGNRQDGGQRQDGANRQQQGQDNQ